MPGFHVREAEEEQSRRFPNFMRYREVAVMEGLDDEQNPRDLMEQQIETTLQLALQKARDRGIEPTKFSYKMTWEELEQPLYTPFRPLEQNNTAAIMNLFEKVGR